MDELEKLKKNCTALKNEFDTNKHDRIITYTEWKNSTKENSEEDWSNFKKKFIEEQKLHMAKMTSATAIQPRPPLRFSAQPGV